MQVQDNHDFRITVRLGTPHDVITISTINGWKSKRIRKLLEAGVMCYLAYYDNEPASLVWLADKDCYIKGMGLHLRLKQGDFYSFGAYTLPEYRKRGLYSQMKYSIAEHLKKAGGYCYTLIEISNPYSLMLNYKYNFQPQDSTIYVKLGCLKINVLRDIQIRERKIRAFLFKPSKAITI